MENPNSTTRRNRPELLHQPKSLNHFSLSLSPFLHMETLAPLSSSHCHTSHNKLDHQHFEDSFSTLSVEEHYHRRSSIITPDSRLSSFSLYPLPPHLTPHHSPIHTRPSSPAYHPSDFFHPEHNLHTSNILGTLNLTVIEARGLAVVGNEKPYVMLQYDRTESISREFGAEEVEPLKKKSKFGSVKGGTSIKQPNGAVSVRRVGSIKG